MAEGANSHGSASRDSAGGDVPLVDTPGLPSSIWAASATKYSSRAVTRTRRGIERGVDPLLHVLQAPIQPGQSRTSCRRRARRSSRRDARLQTGASLPVRRSVSRAFAGPDRPPAQDATTRHRAAIRFSGRRARCRDSPPGTEPSADRFRVRGRCVPDPMRHAFWIVGNFVCTVCAPSALMERLFCVSRRERLGDTARRGLPAPTSSTGS